MNGSLTNHIQNRVLVVLMVAALANTGLCLETGIAQVKVRVETISKQPVTGRLARLSDSQLELRDDSGQIQTLDLKDVLAISATDFDAVRVPEISKTPWLFLSTGDRLRMTPLGVDDESIMARWHSFSLLPPVSLPLELCRGIVMQIPSSSSKQGRSFDSILNHQQKVDLITLSNGDRIEGEFVGFQDEHFTLDTSIGEVQTSVGQTRSLAFNPDLISLPEVSEAFAVLMLSDGSTLGLRSISSDGDLLVAELLGGFELSIPVITLRAIRFYDSNRVNLTKITPAETKVVSYLTMTRQPQTNQNAIGGFLSLRGRLVPSGFGVSSGTTQTWSLDGQYNQFRVTVGVDDAAQGAGSVIFKVLVDGTDVWKSDLLTGTSAPVEIPPVNLSGADHLSLIVENADRGNVLDYANWCEPVLIRTPTDAARE
tara:strand:- start:149841 stop:151118 length:1278 start_codon:yes stop_codon:yes gene_type:complete